MKMKLFDKSDEQQDFHIKMMSDAIDILNKYKIKYAVIGAGLLGAIRDKDLIKWERGIPFLVDSNQIIKKQNYIIKEFKNKFKINRIVKNVNNWKIRASRNLNGIDFVIEIVGHYKLGNNYIRSEKNKKKIIPKNYFDNKLSKIRIRGLKYNIPYNPEGFLTHVYGNWRIPIKSKNPAKFRAKTFFISK